MLAACGGSQVTPASGPAPTSHSINARGESWIAARAENWDLLYVSNVNGTVTVYRYWPRELVGTLAGFDRPKGECVDSRGDIYVTDRVAEDIVEFRHGSTKRVAILADSGYQDYACAVDPTTGNLAVANSYQTDGYKGAIAIYKRARGSPRLYRIEGLIHPQTCAYDPHGDMLVASDYPQDHEQAVAIAYLPKGRTTFIHLDLDLSGLQTDGVYNVQWDGKYWALLYNNNIVRFQIADDGRATYEGTTYLDGNEEDDMRFFIANFSDKLRKQETQIVAAQTSDVRYWKYPSGGKAIGTLSKEVDEPYGVAVSLAPREP
jgi:hypothetical protein